MRYAGEYGGRVVREIRADGTKIIKGAILKPEDVMEWPLSNRLALETAGKVEWYGPPVPEEQAARDSGPEVKEPPKKVATKAVKKEVPAKSVRATRTRTKA